MAQVWPDGARWGQMAPDAYAIAGAIENAGAVTIAGAVAYAVAGALAYAIASAVAYADAGAIAYEIAGAVAYAIAGSINVSLFFRGDIFFLLKNVCLGMWFFTKNQKNRVCFVIQK